MEHIFIKILCVVGRCVGAFCVMLGAALINRIYAIITAAGGVTLHREELFEISETCVMLVTIFAAVTAVIHYLEDRRRP